MTEQVLVPEYLPALVGVEEIEDLLDVLSSSWTVRIIYRLRFGQPLRFLALKRLLNGITNKTLAQRLDALLTQGIVQKIIYAEKTPHVEYVLTKKGELLSERLLTLMH